MDYETAYFKAIGKLSEAIEILDKLSEELKTAQVEAEERFVEEG